MSFLGNILQKLGLGERRTAPPAAGAATTTTAQAPAPSPQGPPPAAPAAPAPISTVDVTARLEQMAAARSQKLNWRESIVDLLKLLDLDSSLESRKALARELGAPAEVMTDSAKMNMWLHRAVIRQLAEHGGNVPPELLR